MSKADIDNLLKKLPPQRIDVGLYVVSTPIGNSLDITLRALMIIKEVDLLLCENTRTTGNLLKTYGLKKATDSYNDVNGANKRPAIIEKLKQGQKIALVSDAGTPLISDPGYKLVSEAIANDINVYPIPGANAALAALTASGVATDSFCFMGFITNKKSAAISQLNHIKNRSGTYIFYETANRIDKSLGYIKEVVGDCYIVIGREITKLHEEFIRGNVSSVIEQIKNRQLKGEIVLIIEVTKQEIRLDDIIHEVANLLRNASSKEVSAIVAEKYGISKKAVYHKCLEIKETKKRK